MEVSAIFKRNLVAYDTGGTLIVNQGGTRSGKTYSILQLLFLIALYSTKPLIISVVSRSLPHLRLGAMRSFDLILLNFGLVPDKVKHKTENYCRIGKSIIEFFGADALDKVHGPERDILFINEANFLRHDVYHNLYIRTRGAVFMDYNPFRKFWYHDEVLGKQQHEFIKSTYIDNPFLPASQVVRIEARKHNEKWWQVYGLGELGVLENAILTYDYGAFPEDVPYGYGLDFGSHDPDALVRCHVDKKNMIIYWKEEFVQNNLLTDMLADEMRARVGKDRLIIADSASRRTVLDLKSKGFNIIAPGKWQLLDSIRLLQKYKLVIDPSSQILAQELDSWVWLDKRGGVPLDGSNHCIDAGRYYTCHVIDPARFSRQLKALY